MRVLIASNMYPRPDRPALGSFVRDQVEALRRRDDLEVELFTFDGGPRGYPAAARELRRRYGRRHGFDVVHAHFGLTAWPVLLARLGAPLVVTLHGNDLFHPRSRAITRAALPLVSLTTAVSREFAGELPGAGVTRRVTVLPCGIDLERFRPIPRAEARAALDLPVDEPCLLFPHDPSRPLKRAERARAAAGDVRLLTMGKVPPERVPLYVNAANAVLVPSQAEGFGLAVIEALACEVPVLGTPVGIHPVALAELDNAYCAPWDEAAWRARLAPLLEAADPRVPGGRQRAAIFSADRMAARAVAAYRALVEQRDDRDDAYTRAPVASGEAVAAAPPASP